MKKICVPREWSQEEIDYILENYQNPNITMYDLASHLNVAWGTINAMMVKLNIKDDYLKTHQRQVWSEEKIEFLKENIHKYTYKELAKELKISYSSVAAKALELGLTTPYKQSHMWTEEEERFLKENYRTMTMTEMKIKLKRSKSAISGKLRCMGLRRINRSIPWTIEDIDFIKENYEKMSYEELASHLNRTVNAVRNKAVEFNLTSKSLRRTKLLDHQVKFIIEHYLEYTDKELAIMFDVSIEAIAAVRKQNHLKKTGNEVKGCTYIEKIIKDCLDEFEINYIFNEFLGDYRPDFYIPNANLIIEVNGDYFHCNPYLYPNGPKDEIQVNHVLKDYYKKCYYLSRGYRMLTIWEKEINDNLDEVKQKIESAVLNRNI